MTLLLRPVKEFNVCLKTLFSIQNNKSIAVKCVKYASTNPVNLSHSFYESKNSEDKKGTPLVIMHGLLGNRNNWRSICKALVEKTNPARNVFALDARNHGESPHDPMHSYASMVEDVVKFLKDQGIEKAAVMGHSMGGRIMMLLALKYPELVERAIIVDITPKPSPSIMGVKTFFDTLQNVNFGNVKSMKDARNTADIQLKPSISDKSIRDFLLTNLAQKEDGSFGWRANLDALRNNFESHIMGFPSDASSLQYSGPMLFIGGGDSDYIREDDFPALKSQLFPNANLTMVANAGHWVHAQKPQIFLELASNFLNSKN